MSASSSPRRYLAVWLRRLATDRLARLSSAPADQAFATVAPIKSALRLASINDAAARLGLTSGMALADARAMYPGLGVADDDPAADRALLTAIADWCDRYTPLVALDPPDGLILDVTGCAHLFGGESLLARDLVARLARQGFSARVAIADTVGGVFAVAHHGTAPTAMILPPGETQDALCALPLAALRLPAETVDALAEVGLKRIADVIERPRAPLAARFGALLLHRIDQALGRADEPISPCLPLPACVAERRFADPIALEADVLGTIEHLAGEMARVLERRGEGARLLQAALFRTDGKVRRIEVGTAEPLRNALRVKRLFTEKLAALADEWDPGFGFDMVRLSALATAPFMPVQSGLIADDHADNAADMAHLIDVLGARFGLRRVTRLVPQDTHIPEFAVAAMPAAAVGSGGHCVSVPSPACTRTRVYPSSALSTGRSRIDPTSAGGLGRGQVGHGIANRTPSPPLPRKRGREREAVPSSQTSYAHDLLEQCAWRDQDTLIPTRPVRLLARPEPIEAIAEVPDGPPARFRWRRVLHLVAVAEGPERIAMEWWRNDEGQALTRDYFRVESRNGIRFWLYREGLFVREIDHPRWFVHGVFA